MVSGKQFQFLGLRGFVGWYEYRWRPGDSPSVPSGHHQLLQDRSLSNQEPTIRQGWPESARVPPVPHPQQWESQRAPQGLLTLTWVLEIKLRVSRLGEDTSHRSASWPAASLPRQEREEEEEESRRRFHQHTRMCRNRATW